MAIEDGSRIFTEGQRFSSSIYRMAAMQPAILLVNITETHYGSLGAHRPGYIHIEGVYPVYFP